MASATENRRVNIYINGKEIKNDMKSIRAEYGKTRNVINNLTVGSREYHDEMKKLNKLKGLIDDHNGRLKRAVTTWGRMKEVMVGVVGANIATNLFERIVNAIPKAIDSAAKLADQFSDVQKNAGLTNDEMEQLQKNLRGIDTRTKNSRLLEIAAVAGKSGVRGVSALTEAVRQLDQVEVALGDDLGDEAVSQLQKVAATFNTEILNIGSGINAISDSTKANAGFLTEWITRLAGASKQVNINAGDALGYGATLDELGLKVEMGSTALNGFLIDFVKNTEKFGNVAGFARGELSALIGKEGTNEGFLSFLQRLKEGSSSSQEFLQKLEAVGITGDRGSQVFLALSQNIDQLRERQQQANVEIEKGTSLTREFETRNNNLAGKLEKLGKKINAIWNNSALKNSISFFVDKLIDYTKVPISDKLRKEQVGMNSLVNQITSANISQEKRNELIQKLQSNYGEYLGNIDLEKASNEQLATQLSKVNDQIVRRIVIESQREKIQEEAAETAEKQTKFLEQQARLENKLAEIGLNKGLDLANKTLKERVEVVSELLEKEARYVKNEKYGGTTALNQEAENLDFIRDKYYTVEHASNQFLAAQQRLAEVTEMANGIIAQQSEGLDELKKELEVDGDLVVPETLTIEQPVELKPVFSEDKKAEQIEAFAARLRAANEDYLAQAKELAQFGPIGKDDKEAIDEATSDPDTEIQNLIDYYEKLLTIARDYGYKTLELERELEALRYQQKVEDFQKLVESIAFYYQELSSIANLYLDSLAVEDNARLDSIERRKNAEMQAIDDAAEHSRKSHRQVESEKAKVDEKFAKESAKIKEEQWKKQQLADVLQSAINVVLAVTRQGVTTPQAIATGIAGAAKTAFIASRKPPKFYARGVMGSPKTRAVVGEQGPELIDLPEGSNVYTAPQTEDLLTPALQPRLNFSGVAPEGNAALISEIKALRSEVRSWPTRVKGVWVKDDFDNHVEREKFADSLVDIG